MEKFELTPALKPTMEQMMLNDERYFNEKFPPIRNWLGIKIRSQEFQDDGGNTIDFRPNRVELVVETINDAPNASSTNEDLFVCFYELDNDKRRSRAEKLVSSIYPIYSADKTD